MVVGVISTCLSLDRVGLTVLLHDMPYGRKLRRVVYGVAVVFAVYLVESCTGDCAFCAHGNRIN